MSELNKRGKAALGESSLPLEVCKHRLNGVQKGCLRGSQVGLNDL